MLQIFPFYLAPETGGASGVRTVIETTAKLTGDRWRHTVLTPAPSPYDGAFAAAGMEVVTLRRRRHLILRRTSSPIGVVWHLTGLVADAARIALLVRRRRIDIVHAHGAAYLGGLLGARLARRPAILHVHERMDRLSPRAARLYRRVAARLATRVVLIAGFLEQEWAGSGAATVSIPNTVAWDAPAANASGAVVGFLGRIAPRKGIEHLLRAFALVHAELAEARLVIVGGPAEPEDFTYLASLRDEAERLELGSAVEFAGPTSEPERALATFAVLVFTSPIDIAPITVLQAMSMGIPVVSASDGGAAEMVDDGVTGFSVSPADEPAIARAILALLRNPDLRASMSVAARERFSSNYGPEAYAERVEELYARLAR